MKPGLSVIIPVYNGEATLEKAIESVVLQTYKNIQIIVVDDGSTDSTGQIIENYKSADPRIIGITKMNNEGLSAARNAGVQAAEGEYFTFVDADDTVERDAYEALLASARGADVVVCGFYHDTLNPDGTLGVSIEDKPGESCMLSDKKEILSKAAMLDRKRLFAYTCNKLYKKSFVEATGIVFENQQLIEDHIYNCKIFDRLTSLVLVDCCYYHYVKFLRTALTQRYRPDYFEIIDKRYIIMKTLFEKNACFSGENRKILCNMHIKHIIAGIIKNCDKKSGLDTKQQRAIIKGLFSDKSCIEAIEYSSGGRVQEIICNAVFATKNVTLNLMFARMLYKMQLSKRNLFDRLK